MSRAFLKDSDGWSFCREKNRDCILAEADGSCSIGHCKYEGAGKKKDTGEKDTCVVPPTEV